MSAGRRCHRYPVCRIGAERPGHHALERRPVAIRRSGPRGAAVVTYLVNGNPRDAVRGHRTSLLEFETLAAILKTPRVRTKDFDRRRHAIFGAKVRWVCRH